MLLKNSGRRGPYLLKTDNRLRSVRDVTTPGAG